MEIGRRNTRFSGGAAPQQPGSLDLHPIDVPDAPEVLASVLRSKILSDDLPEGASLPTERELGEQTRLSRPTVREALRILQLQGLVVRRPGRNGGAVVARPAAADVITWLDLYLQGSRLDRAVLMEVREIIEPACAALAAKRRSEEDLRILEACDVHMADVVDDLPAYVEANLAWHIAVAEASHNQLLTALMHALSRAVLRQTSSERLNTSDVRTTAVKAHRLITAAIRARDTETARRRMERHVHGFATELIRVEGEAAPDPTPIAGRL